MSRDTTFEEQVQEALQSKSSETRSLAERLQKNWAAGVTPGMGDLRRLQKLLRVVRPCARLQDDGRCSDWLRKHGAAAGLVAEPPFTCPFAGGEKTESRFSACPGFQTG